MKMDLKELVKFQKEFDKKHGFSNKYSKKMLMRVTLALLGECGELANLVKKYTRSESAGGKHTIPDRGRPYLEEAREELADIFIYLMKLSMILGTDLEDEYLKKLEKNKKKFKDFRKGT